MSGAGERDEAPITPVQRAMLQYIEDAEARGLRVFFVPDNSGEADGKGRLVAVDPNRPEDWPAAVHALVAPDAQKAGGVA